MLLYVFRHTDESAGAQVASLCDMMVLYIILNNMELLPRVLWAAGEETDLEKSSE